MVKRIAVLGGGISGLAAAWNLARKGLASMGGHGQLEVALFEASNRVGGWMRSEHSKDGAVFELGPRSLRTAGVAGKTSLEVIANVGLEKELLHVTAGHVSAQKRFIYTQSDGLVEAPSGLSWVFNTKRPFTKPLFGAVMRDLLFAKKGSEDETVNDFFSRRMSQEVADYLVDPLCRGVFASSPKSLSLRSCFPLFHQYETKYGSVIMGLLRDSEAPLDSNVSPLIKQSVAERWTTVNLKNGLQSLPDAMLNQITDNGVPVFMQQPCTGLTFDDGKVKVEAGGQTHEFDHVVSSIPSTALSNILSVDSSSVSSDLKAIKSVSVGVACLEFKGENILPQEMQAFGYLVPSNQQSKVLGVIFDSASFPEHDRKDAPSTRLTVMMGGEWFNELFGDPSTASEDTILATALETLQEHLGISQEPSHTIVSIEKGCIPQYSVGHSRRLDTIFGYIEENQLPLTLVGSSYRGVSVNDCIYHALQATNKLV